VRSENSYVLVNSYRLVIFWLIRMFFKYHITCSQCEAELLRGGVMALQNLDLTILTGEEELLLLNNFS